MNDNNTRTFKELQPGTILNAGKYIIEKKIGEGGFGITYKATQKGLNRAVCIKEYFLAGGCVRNTQARTVHLQGISDERYEKYRQAFVKEAQTLASLHHPNIVEVIDIFDENNTSYMVMSFIEGRSLQDIVDSGGPLSYPDAVNYMAQITNAVGYIHEHNILHRDIKPENIMITANYKAILIDFGSAREFEQDRTQMHTSMLTHGYAPPEQYTANSKKGSYTDIYALGATLYFILTGQVPLEAAARLTEELVEPKQLNPSIPTEGNRTIMKAMKLKKEERYQLVQDFMNDLKNVSGGTIRDGNEGNSGFKSKRWMLWILVSVLLLLGGVVTKNIISHQRSVKQQEYAEMDSLYVNSLKNFYYHLQRIYNDPKDLSNPTYVVEALDALKTIEALEKKDFLKVYGKKPCYQEKLQLYIDKVEKENKEIDSELFYYEVNGYENREEYQKLNEKLSKNTEIVTQLKATGSAIQVVLKP